MRNLVSITVGINYRRRVWVCTLPDVVGFRAEADALYQTRYVRGVVAPKVKRYDCSVSAIKTLSENLRALRAAKSFTQEEAAEHAGVTYRYYQDIEGAARAGVRIATVERLAKAFGVAAHQLLDPAFDPKCQDQRRTR